MNSSVTPVDTVLLVPTVQWQAAASSHREELSGIVDPYLAQRSQGGKDPILDFLFEYYAFRPARLLKWTPGFGMKLEGDPGQLDLDNRFVERVPGGFCISEASFPVKRLAGLRWTLQLLAETIGREPAYGCHGLHEWAMVYQTPELRHSQFPLRLGAEETDKVVRESKLLCTHFDAYRFFAMEAESLNRRVLTRQSMTQVEQPGCLHANMDLYKWAYKHFPWISSGLIRRAFLLALEIRRVDMRASPYDLSAVGLHPICIENEAGKAEYRRYQHEFYMQARSVRKELIAELSKLYDAVIIAIDEPMAQGSEYHQDE